MNEIGPQVLSIDDDGQSFFFALAGGLRQFLSRFVCLLLIDREHIEGPVSDQKIVSVQNGPSDVLAGEDWLRMQLGQFAATRNRNPFLIGQILNGTVFDPPKLNHHFRIIRGSCSEAIRVPVVQAASNKMIRL